MAIIALRLALASAVAVSTLVTGASAQTVAPAASRAAVPRIPFKVRTLANGLKVFSALDRSTPNVSVQVWYDVGGKDDPQGRSGFAHLFEHIMFKGTRNMPDEFLDRLTEDVGGQNNAFTAEDMTAYHEVIPANHLERLLWAEAERMSSLTVNDANFRSEREVVKEELRQSTEANPYGRFFSIQIPDASFSVHPYKRPVIGSIADLDSATLKDVQAFHDTYYRPDNANLIVVGNFDEAQLNAWVDRYFGPITRPSTPIPRVTAVEPARTGPREFTGYGPTVPLPAVGLSFLIPSAPNPDAPALSVADAILSAGKSSRLYRDLVYQSQVATSVNSQADLRQQPGLFLLYAILAGGKTPEQGIQALRAELAKLRDASVSAAELARAKNQLIANALEERETINGRAMGIGNAVVLERDAERVNTRLAALQAVSAADVQRVARKYLVDERRVTMRYLDASARPKGAVVPVASPPSPPVAAATAPGAPAAPTTTVSARQAPPQPGPTLPVRPPAPVQRVLANGLTVIVAKTSDLPLVTASLTVRSGATADPQGLAGLAGVTAALLPQGTTTRSAPQIADAVEALGGSITASSSFDGSDLTLTVLADQLPTALPILADVARHPAFAQAELDRLRTQKLDALSVTLKTPGGLASLAAWPAIWGGSAYGHVAGGTPASLVRITRADVTALYGRQFRPDNAVLVITGGIAPGQAFALAERAFGDWVRPSAPLAAPSAGIPIKAPRVIAIDLPGAGQAAVTVVAPSIRRSDPAYYPARVANAVLGGGYSARLNQEVRIKRGLSYGAGSSLSTLRDAGLFRASAQTKNASAGEVATLMLDMVKSLGEQPIAPAEVDPRKAALIGAFGRETEQSSGLADLLGNGALYGVPLSETTQYVARVQAVTPEQARAAARLAVDPARATLIIVGEASAFLPDLKRRFPNVEVIPAAALDLDSPTLRRAAASR